MRSSNSPPRRAGAWALAIIGALILVFAWAPGAFAPYQYDDFVTPVKDPASQSLGAWLGEVPTTLRPLTKLTFALESSLGATTAPARRVLNGALFLAAIVVLARLLRLSGASAVSALLLALAWGVHPVHAESVLALAGRSVLLATLLSFASAECVLSRRHALAIALALLAVFARETAWPWLVVAAGLVAHQQQRTDRATPSRGRVLVASSGALAIGACAVLASSRMRELLAGAYSDGRAFDRLGLQWAALAKGTAMLVTGPASFSVDIDFAPLGLMRVALIAGAAAMYATALWLSFRSSSSPTQRVAALLWLSFAIPLHSVVPKLDPLTARSFSASSAALLMLAVASMRPALSSVRRFRHALPAAAACAVFVLLPTTRARALLYQDPVALWEDAAARSTSSVRPLVNLATLLAQRGRADDAVRILEEAQKRAPLSNEVKMKLEAARTLRETRSLLTDPEGRATLEHEGHSP